ncbi:TPA: hypothetical protein DEP58_00670 [Patescibacteria group bacterium]|nr:MAG: Radical SAM domain protein [Parcubacteria group bacterium GW2011_GWD2_42_14]HCC04802.1 hypothetical protein [Patescibacteria group bacterium]
MITIRSATPSDLDGIMAVEEKKWEEGTAATREVMANRITICNNEVPHHFFVTEENGAITGYLVMQPTNLTPDACVSWTSATDNGAMETTYEPDGVNLYIVSIGAISPPKASADTADRIIARVMNMWCQHGGLIMFTARMPGFATAHEKTGITVEEYWQQKKADGGPLDAGIHFYWSRSGHVFPERLLKNGFPTDVRSGGHAVLFVLRDILRGQEGIQDHLCRAAHHEGKKSGRKKTKSTPPCEQQVALLDGGSRQWWDITKNGFVKMHTLYIPQGCRDWNHCTFCPIPHAVEEYEQMFYGGQHVSDSEIVSLFNKSLTYAIEAHGAIHTLCLFNAGSFLSDVTNPPHIREQIIDLVCQVPLLSRLIIETRANYVTEKCMHTICAKLGKSNIDLTVRIGVETQNEALRQKILRKGQSDKILRKAVHIIHTYGALVGGYVLLNPAPFSKIKALLDLPAETSEDDILTWAEEEASRSLDFVLGHSMHDLNMDEAYFCSTNVGTGTALTRAWKKNDFHPATLRSVCRVLRYGITSYGARVHMLPFTDERTYLAVPSNHVREGIAPDLSNAFACDEHVHAILDTYRATMNPHVLVEYPCDCNNK